jgi:uncharacterized protein
MAAAEQRLRIELVRSDAPRQTTCEQVLLPLGSTVREALSAVGWLQGGAEVGVDVGVWGQRVPMDHVLRDRDRVELYRPLRVDPKEARRQRYRKQPARKAPAPRKTPG